MLQAWETWLSVQTPTQHIHIYIYKYTSTIYAYMDLSVSRRMQVELKCRLCCVDGWIGSIGVCRLGMGARCGGIQESEVQRKWKLTGLHGSVLQLGDGAQASALNGATTGTQDPNSCLHL